MKIVFSLLVLIAGAGFAAGLTQIDSSIDGLVYELDAPQPEFKTLNIRGDNFSAVFMEDAEALSVFSMPRVPVYRTWIEIPVGAEVTVEITEESILDIAGPAYPIQPGIQSANKNEPRENFTMRLNSDVYSGGSYPAGWINIIYPGELRGRNLAIIEVTPLLWNASDNTCQLLSEATLNISFEGGDIAQTFAQADRYYAPPFEQTLDILLDNYGTFESGSDTPPAPYLIIGHSDFVETGMADFVAWKESIGFDVTMVDLSVTGTQDTAIQSYIQNAVETWATPPQYVLLVGDTGFLPAMSGTEYSGVSDLYYACLDDGGFFPDVFLGRFSVTTTGEAIMMADRVIDYEQNISGATSWVQNTCWIASSDNSNVSEGTHNYCIDSFFAPLGYTYDKVYPASGGTASQAVSSINGGISMLTFSGHGSETSWADMSFSSSDFGQLTNDGMFPGVFSHSCVTGNFAVSTCWGETWTRTPGRGGLWFFGSVPNTLWDEDDIQERAEYQWFLGDGVYWAKGFCNGGLYAVYDYYSGGGNSKYYFEGYTLFGDPSVQMAVWGVTGVEEQTGGIVSGNLGIFAPNPVRSSAMVTLSGNGFVQLSVFDIAGRIVETPFSGSISGEHTLNWNTSDLAPGMYFLRLTQGNDVSSAKVMVIN